VGVQQQVTDVCCSTCVGAFAAVPLEVDSESALSDALSNKKVDYDITLTSSIEVSKPLWVAGKKRLAGAPGVELSGGAAKTVANVADGAALELRGLTVRDAAGAAVCVNHGGDLIAQGVTFRGNANLHGRRLEEQNRRLSSFASGCSGKPTGVHSLELPSGEVIDVLCDGDTDGGGWMLLLSQVDVIEQFNCTTVPTLHGCPGMPGSTEDVDYPGSASPFAHDLAAGSPSDAAAYARNWTHTGLDPQIGDEFLLKRGSTGDWVRFVQLGPWCGWDQTRNCMPWVDRDTQHGFYTMGTVYDQDGTEFTQGGASGTERFKYFNSCTKAGGCMREGTDGVGFGVLESHLRATDGNGGFGGTWGPPCLRWNSDACDDGDRLPYTYWFRSGTGEVTETPSWMMPCTTGGGAIAAEGDNSILVLDSLFIDNTAEIGGAVHLKASEAGDYFTKPSTFAWFINVNISWNSASYDGGGISVAGTSNNRQVYVDISDSVVDSNSAGLATENRGGGISVSKAFLRMWNTTLSNNVADIGGGASFRKANVEASRCTVSGNVAVTRRGFAAGLSIEDSSTVELEGVFFDSNAADPSSGDPAMVGIDIYLGDGSLQCGSVCEPGTYETNLTTADCADAYYSACPEPCGSASPDPSTCTPCGPGSFNPAAGALGPSDCVSCPAGKSSATRGLASASGCLSCEAGLYAEAGAAACAPCAAGRSAVALGSESCVDCPPGRYAGTQGRGECKVCDIGSYSAQPGATSCSSCPAGRSTFSPLSDSREACLCGAGWLLLGDGSCAECSAIGATCPGGVEQTEVRAQPGFFLLAGETEQGVAGSAGAYARAPELYRCSSIADCPGSMQPNECPPGHTGLVCAECAVGFSRENGECAPCSESGVQGGVAMVAGAILFLSGCGAFLWVGRNPYQIHLRLVDALTASGGIMITYLQLHNILEALAVAWPDSMRASVFEVSRLAALDEGHLSLDCYWKPSPVARFLPKLVMVPAAVLVTSGLFCISRAIPPLRRRLRSIDCLYSAWGFIGSLAFVPLATHTSNAVNCYSHPGGKASSMRAIPSLLCFESEWNSTILPAAAISFVLFVLGTYSAFVYLTIKSPSFPWAETRLGFLVGRFRPDVYFWGVPLLTRNLILTLAPVFAPDKPFVGAILIVITCLCYQSAVLYLSPWKYYGHTLADAITTGAFAVTVVAGIAFSDAPTYPIDSAREDPSWVFLAVCVTSPFFVSLAAMLYAVRQGARRSGQRARAGSLNSFRQEVAEMVSSLSPLLALAQESAVADESLQRNLEAFGAHDIAASQRGCLLILSLLLGIDPSEELFVAPTASLGSSGSSVPGSLKSSARWSYKSSDLVARANSTAQEAQLRADELHRAFELRRGEDDEWRIAFHPDAHPARSPSGHGPVLLRGLCAAGAVGERKPSRLRADAEDRGRAPTP